MLETPPDEPIVQIQRVAAGIILSECSPLAPDIDCKGSSNSRPHSNSKCLLERIERKEPGHNQCNSSGYYDY
jgi:hypothetical protein